MHHRTECDVLIVGGGVGGCAAALAATATGKRVIMTEETDWIGGQFTAQAVPPDENRYIEKFGCTYRYRRFRNAVRDYYRRNYPLTPEAHGNPTLNPGMANVSRICHEPPVSLAVLHEMLRWAQTSGRLRILLETSPVAAETDGDKIRSVTLEHAPTGRCRTIAAPYVLDATELGDLLPMTGTEYVSGAESQAETGEPHAADEADPDNVQSLTWCFATGWDPDAKHVIDEPEQYARWRDFVPELTPPWPGKLLGWTTTAPQNLKDSPRCLFPEEAEDRKPLWTFRRIVCRNHYPPDTPMHEVTLVNWPQIDYVCGNLIDAPEADVERYRHEARQLSLSFLYWMQTDAPRGGGGHGYPQLYLRGDMTGTDDGLAKYAYIRESRRIRAKFTVTELHVGAEARGKPTSEKFPDSVGIGHYRIDLHPSTGGDNYIDIPSLPFQIPLGSLIPVRMRNLLPACKNLGVTHITNGCYRLHPVEWNIGEAAGLLVSFCMDRRSEPHAVYGDAALLADFQRLLVQQGVELDWPTIHA